MAWGFALGGVTGRVGGAGVDVGSGGGVTERSFR